MGRDRTGSIYKDTTGAVYGRITWTDSKGKRRQRKRKAISGAKREARQHIKDLHAELEEQGEERSIDAARLTFRQLADYYKAEYAIEATYDKHGIKKGGLRSFKDAQRKLVILKAHFVRRVREISYEDIATFKRLRLKTPVEIKKRDGKRKEKKYRIESHRSTANSRCFAVSSQLRFKRNGSRAIRSMTATRSSTSLKSNPEKGSPPRKSAKSCWPLA